MDSMDKKTGGRSMVMLCLGVFIGYFLVQAVKYLNTEFLWVLFYR